MIRIGIDAMGGDYAPHNVVLGAISAFASIGSDSELILIGDKFKITEICRQNDFDPSIFSIVHTTQTIAMGDHPQKAYMKNEDSSIVRGFSMLANGEIDVFASAGNTGAMVVGTMYKIKVLNGVFRPCISILVPQLDGSRLLMLDVGFNTDCKPDILYQYALLGSIYAREMLGIESPKVALLNIGKEEEKGSIIVREAYKIMSYSKELRFVGNMEANNLFKGGYADVLVTDGFVGNTLLKTVEGLFDMISTYVDHDFISKFDYEIYGGTPVLGVLAPVIIGHGASSPLAISNMISQARKCVESGLIEKLKKGIVNENN